MSSEFSRIKGQRSKGAKAQRELIADYGDFADYRFSPGENCTGDLSSPSTIVAKVANAVRFPAGTIIDGFTTGN